MSFFYDDYLSGSGREANNFSNVELTRAQHLSDGSTVWVLALGNYPEGYPATYQAWLYYSPDHKTVIQVLELNSAIETVILNSNNAAGNDYGADLGLFMCVDNDDNVYVVASSGISGGNDRTVVFQALPKAGSSWSSGVTTSFDLPTSFDNAIETVTADLNDVVWCDTGATNGHLFLAMRDNNPGGTLSPALDYRFTVNASDLLNGSVTVDDYVVLSYSGTTSGHQWTLITQSFGGATGLTYDDSAGGFQTFSIDSGGSVSLGSFVNTTISGPFLGLNDGETIVSVQGGSANVTVTPIVNGVIGASVAASESSLGIQGGSGSPFQDPIDPESSFWVPSTSYGGSTPVLLQVTLDQGVPTFGELVTVTTAAAAGNPGFYAAYARGTTQTVDSAWTYYYSGVELSDGSYTDEWYDYYGSLRFYKTGSGSVELEPVLLRSVQTITGNASVPLSSGVATNTLRGYRQGTVFGTTPYGSSTYGDPSRSVQSGNFSAAPLTARALDYYSILLSWEIPAAGTQIQLVRNNFSAPADQNDGIVLLSGDPASAATYTDTALSLAQQGTFLYYTLWNYGKDPISGLTQWWRAADVQTILPKQWGYGPNLFGLIPEKYRADDDALSVVLSVLVDNYTELAGATAYSSAQGQPLMVIGMEGGASTQSGGALRPSPTGGAKAQSSASGDPDEAISADSVAETRAGSSTTASPTWRTL